jgi:hypothetical protein
VEVDKGTAAEVSRGKYVCNTGILVLRSVRQHTHPVTYSMTVCISLCLVSKKRHINYLISCVPSDFNVVVNEKERALQKS